MSPNHAVGLREAGIKAGAAVLRHAPKIIEAVHEIIASEDLEQVDLLIRVMAAFDRDTAEHLEAVGTMSALLAYHASLSAATMANCLLAGRVHDIGKTAISRSVLQTSRAPSKSEWDDLKLIPFYGHGTLSGLPRLKHLAPFVLACHERIDGLGYPHGLAGEEIPLESQIVAIADAFCAMTAPRPYSAARLPLEAIEELKRNAGTQFDIDLIDTFSDMFRGRGLDSV